jgi:hypothetical protein
LAENNWGSTRCVLLALSVWLVKFAGGQCFGDAIHSSLILAEACDKERGVCLIIPYRPESVRKDGGDA